MKKEDLNLEEFLYNPFDKDSLKKLQEIDEFKPNPADLDKEKLLRYIILMYDFNTPLRKEYPDYWKRKKEASKLAGYICNVRLEKRVEELLLEKDMEINNMILKYIMLHGDPDYVMLHTYSHMYVIINFNARSGEFGKDDIKNIKELNIQIKELTERLFGGEPTDSLRNLLYKRIEEDRAVLTPEDFADQLTKGEDPLEGFDVYDKGYKPEKPKYLGHE